MTLLKDSSAEKHKFEAFINEKINPKWIEHIYAIQRRYFPTAISLDLKTRIILLCGSIWIAKLLYAKNPHNNQLIKEFKELKKAAINYRDKKIKSSEFTKYHIAYNINSENPTPSNIPDSMPFLDLEIEWYEAFINGIPKKSGGKRATITIKNILARLVKIALDGGLELKLPSHDRTSDNYGGTLYNFILDIQPLLEKINIDLGTDKTIGRNLLEIMSKLKKSEITLSTIGHILPIHSSRD